MSESSIMNLLEKSQITDFVKQHPQGLHSMISDQSSGVSVGQAQRIALARALSQQASVFILDEPTASLDEQSAEAVMVSLSQAITDNTAIMVTHKLEELTGFDNIIVLDKGVLIEQGNYTSLMATQGKFYQLQQQEANV